MVDLIIIDSVAALVPEAELNGEITDHNVGGQARMMSKACRMIRGVCNSTKTTVIFINQIREKVGVMFGNPETTPGGKALKFYASVRMEITKGSKLKSGDAVVGFRPKIKFIKNKVGAPFTEATYDICVGHPDRPVYGVDCNASLIDVGQDMKIVTKKGNFFQYDSKAIGNGMSKASAFLDENPDVANKLREEIYSTLTGGIDLDNLPEEELVPEED